VDKCYFCEACSAVDPMRDEGDSEEGDDIKNLPRKGTPLKMSCTPFKVVKNRQTQVYK
jgi:hypothetical protein